MKIAIPTSTSKVQFYLNQAYVDYIFDAGFEPVAVYPRSDLQGLVGNCQGLLLPGGIDIDPIYYGQDNDNSSGADQEKDAFERRLFHFFRELGKPIFGICRGFQLIAREFMAANPDLERTGVLYYAQHLNYHNQVNDQSLNRNSFQHWVDIIPNFLYKNGMVNIGRMPVNSMHHQALMVELIQGKNKLDINVGSNMSVAAWTKRGIRKEDKNYYVCEAAVFRNWGSNIMGVQWHPEELRDVKLLQSFFV